MELRGSTLFEISGKGDIEVGLYVAKKDWHNLLMFLINYFKHIDNLEKDYARFNDKKDTIEVEIILFSGYAGHVDKKLTQYLLDHPTLLKEYETRKKRFAYSKREYQKQKDIFFREVIAQIP